MARILGPQRLADWWHRTLGRLRWHGGPLLVIAIAFLLGQIWTLTNAPLVSIHSDSATYLAVAQHILHGQGFFDLVRTPGYPLFLALVFAVTGGQHLDAVVDAQVGLMALMVLQIYAIGYRLGARRWLATMLTAAISMNVFIMQWEANILSEALATLLLITEVYYFERYLRSQKWIFLVAFAVVGGMLVLTRPAFLFIPALLVVVLLARSGLTRTLRQHWLKLLVGACLAYGLVGAYVVGNGTHTGYYGLSEVGDINLFDKVLEYHMQDEGTNPQSAQFRQDLDTFLRNNPPNHVAFFHQYPQYQQPFFRPVGDFTKDIIAHHPLEFAQKTIPDLRATVDSGQSLYHPMPLNGFALTVANDQFVGYGAEWVLVLAALAWVVWRPRSDTAWLALSLGLIIAATIILAAVGARSEFYRLRTPVDWAMILLGVCALGKAASLAYHASLNRMQRLALPTLSPAWQRFTARLPINADGRLALRWLLAQGPGLRRHAVALAGIAFAIALGQILLLNAPLVAQTPDSQGYLNAATQLLYHGRWTDLYRPPGYPSLVALAYVLAGAQFPNLLIDLQTIVMFATIVEIYWLVYRLSGRQWLAAVLASAVALDVYIIQWERLIMSEGLAMWALVTVFIAAERYLRAPSALRLAWLAGIAAAGILIRPALIFLPALFFLLLGIHSLQQRRFKGQWQQLLFALIMVYNVAGIYIIGNGIFNNYFALSAASDVNQLGKVMEYRMQNEGANPRYAPLAASVNAYVAIHGRNSEPYGFLTQQHGFNPDSYVTIGRYSRDIFATHASEFVGKSLPDMQKVLTQPASAALPISAATVAIERPALTAIYSASLALPVLIVLLGVLVLLRPRNIAALLTLGLALALGGDVLVNALGAYASFERLRLPFDWMVLVFGGIVVGETVLALMRQPSRLFARVAISAPSAAINDTAGIAPSAAIDPITSTATVALPRVTTVADTNTLRLPRTQPSPPAWPSGPIGHDPLRQTVIMGAGPAGLTAAYELTRHQVPTLVLEADQRYVGGISRTVEHAGNRFDVGGHRFFSKSSEVEALWSEILGDELLTRPRLSRILYRGKYFAYPLRAFNALRGLGLPETVRCLASYAAARLHPVRQPQNLEQWVSNQFGKRLFRIFFKTYTEKVWGIPCDQLSADWAAQRIKGLNLSEAIKNALFPTQSGQDGGVHTTLIEQFRYPRLGPGQMWERAQALITARGQQVRLGQEVVRVAHDGSRVTSITVRDVATGQTRQVTGEHFLSTLPIRDLVERCDPPLPPAVQHAAARLAYRDFLTVAVVVNRAEVFPDNWIYLHDPGVVAGRIQNFKNWSPAMVADPNTTCLGLEYFCFAGDGLWTAPDHQLVDLARRELVQLGMCRAEEVASGVVVRQPKAYPVYDETYKQHLGVIRDYVQAHLVNLQLVGRNGMHHYNNQDHSMMTALLAARNIALGTQFDPWKVNTEAEYHEDARWDAEDATGRQVPRTVAAAK